MAQTWIDKYFRETVIPAVARIKAASLEKLAPMNEPGVPYPELRLLHAAIRSVHGPSSRYAYWNDKSPTRREEAPPATPVCSCSVCQAQWRAAVAAYKSPKLNRREKQIRPDYKQEAQILALIRSSARSLIAHARGRPIVLTGRDCTAWFIELARLGYWGSVYFRPEISRVFGELTAKAYFQEGKLPAGEALFFDTGFSGTIYKLLETARRSTYISANGAPCPEWECLLLSTEGPFPQMFPRMRLAREWTLRLENEAPSLWRSGRQDGRQDVRMEFDEKYRAALFILWIWYSPNPKNWNTKAIYQ